MRPHRSEVPHEHPLQTPQQKLRSLPLLRCRAHQEIMIMEKVAPNIFQYQTLKGERFMARLEHGGHQIRQKGFDTKEKATDWLTKFRADLVDQKYFPERVEAPPLNEIAEQWLKDAAHKNLRHNTLRSYTANLTTHVLPILGAIPLNRITRTHMADFVAAKKRERKGKPYSRDAIRLMLAPLSCIFTDALDEGRYGVETNPCPKPSRRRTLVLSVERLDIILMTASLQRRRKRS